MLFSAIENSKNLTQMDAVGKSSTAILLTLLTIMDTRFERLVEQTSLSPAMSFATKPMIQLQILAMVSAFINFFRIRVEENPGRFIFPSMLIILEAPSGAGKNAGCSFMSQFIFGLSFRAMQTYWGSKEEELLKEFGKEIKAKAIDKYGEDIKDYERKRQTYETKRLSEFHDAKRKVNVKTPHSGSYEGFAADRAYMEKLELGAPFILVEEYGNKLLQMRRAAYLQTMYNSLVDLVDNDELEGKSIKDKKFNTPGSAGMGITNLFTLSNPTGVQKQDIRSAVLQAVGRRGFLAKETLESLNFDNVEEIKEYSLDELEKFECEVKELFDSLLKRAEGEKDTLVIPITEGARKLYHQYVLKNRQLYKKHALGRFPSDSKNAKATLLKDLDRKALKVATLLSVFNHGEEQFHITKDDISQAATLVLGLYKAAVDFFEDKQHTLTEKLLAYLESKGDASASELWEEGCFPDVKSRSNQIAIREIMLDEVEPMAKDLGFVLGHFKKGKQDRYRLTKSK